ncbi:MAG: transcription elongation factor GreA [Candidatus Campbellbacteria bacterium]|nr:transcription elongation factor GreA [Candidatus Campbellbacteria bacterium]
MQQEYLSPEKFQELKAELDNLKNVERKKVTEALEYAKSLGDLSENAEYHEARDNQAKIEARIVELESMLKSAVVISSKGRSDIAQAGSKITIQNKEDKKKRTFTIVSSEESDIDNGKLSYHSPIGAAVMGKKKGDEFTVRTPNGETTYKLMDIE